MRAIEQFYDPVKGMFLPDRYIKGECPNCGAKDQYGDSCEVCGAVYAPTDLKNPYSTLTGATPVMKSSEHYFFQLCDPRCVEFLQQWTADGRLQPEVLNKIKRMVRHRRARGQCAAPGQRLGHQPRRALLRHPRSPSAGQVLLRLARRADRLPGVAQELLRQDGAGDCDRASTFLADPAVEQIHFIGKDITYFHTLFWPAMLHFSGRKMPDQVFVHGFITVSGEKMSKSRGTGISPLQLPRARHERRVAALLHRRQAQRPGRGRRLQPRRLRRARQQRPGRQVHQHRQPLRRASSPSASAASCRPTSAWKAASLLDGLRAHRDTSRRSSTRSASSARRCARSCCWPTASTSTSTSTSPGNWPSRPDARPRCTTCAASASRPSAC